MLQQFIHLNSETATYSNPLQGTWTTMIITGSIGPLALTINEQDPELIHKLLTHWSNQELPKPDLHDFLRDSGFQFFITELREFNYLPKDDFTLQTTGNVVLPTTTIDQ